MRLFKIFLALSLYTFSVIGQGDKQTVIFKEDGGVPGNECLTFRNNGNIVDAACVRSAVDRKISMTTFKGQNVLKVERTFTRGFRPDLVNKKDICIGFRGKIFQAEDCNTPGMEFVTLNGRNQLVTQSGACHSGHNGKAEIVVDRSGRKCSTVQII